MMIVAAAIHSGAATWGMAAAQARLYLINGIAPIISMSHPAQAEIEKTRILDESVATKNLIILHFYIKLRKSPYE
jgi:hypothetical protein